MKKVEIWKVYGATLHSVFAEIQFDGTAVVYNDNNEVTYYLKPEEYEFTKKKALLSCLKETEISLTDCARYQKLLEKKKLSLELQLNEIK